MSAVQTKEKTEAKKPTGPRDISFREALFVIFVVLPLTVFCWGALYYFFADDVSRFIAKMKRIDSEISDPNAPIGDRANSWLTSPSSWDRRPAEPVWMKKDWPHNSSMRAMPAENPGVRGSAPTTPISVPQHSE